MKRSSTFLQTLAVSAAILRWIHRRSVDESRTSGRHHAGVRAGSLVHQRAHSILLTFAYEVYGYANYL